MDDAETSRAPFAMASFSQTVMSEEIRPVLSTKTNGCDQDRPKKRDQQTKTRAYEQYRGQLWKGCDIACLFKANTRRYDDMEDLGNFINGIHEWGMGDYGRCVVRDVEDIYAGM